MKKFLSILLLIVGLFFINSPFVYAKENIMIKDIRIVEHSDTATVDNITYENNTISSKISFNELNDFITLNIELENTTDKNIKLDSITNNIDNDYIAVETESLGEIIPKNSTIPIKVKIKYNNELINHTDINLENASIGFVFKEPSLLSNPVTSTGIIIFIILISTILIVTLTTKNKKNKALLILLFLIPTFAYAIDGYDFELKFTDITIKARNLQYRITINNGNNTSQDITRTYGEPIGELPEAPKPGYNQTGWINQDEEPITPETIIQDELTITPTYEIITYNISYNLNGGTLEEENENHYTVEDEITLKNPTKVGYTFRGWSSDGGQTYQTEYTISKGTTGNLNLEADFSANQDTLYKVIHRKMNMNGEYKVAETEELHGATDTEVTPQRKSYTGFIQPVAQTKNINADGSTEFIYDYEREKYNFTITDRTNLESNSTANGEYYYETDINLTAKEKAGYDFAWSDGNTNYTRTFKLSAPTTLTPVYTAKTDTPYKVIHKTMNMDGETYSVRDEITYKGTTDEEVTPTTNTYEGFITPATKTVKIKGNGSTEVEYLYEREKYSFVITDRTYIDDSSTEDGEYFYDTDITIKANSRPGYDFAWSDEDTNLTRTFKLIGPITITPVYTPQEGIEYKVIHKKMNLDGETYSTEEEETLNGTTGTEVRPSTKTYDGFTAPNRKTATINGDGSTVVEYLYERNKYTLTLVNPDDIESNKTSGKHFYDTEISLTAKDKEDYTFEKWSNNQTNKHITFNLREDTSIEAIYRHNNYFVTFNPNCNEFEETTKEVEYNTAIGTMPTLEREEYRFMGWYLNLDSSTPVASDYVPQSNITLYAKWEKSETINCKYTGELVEGTTFTRGQYTYKYKNQLADSNEWATMTEDGWSVVLTDKESTEPVTSTLCTNINNIPVISTQNMFAESQTTSIDTSSFNTTNVKYMHGMFRNTVFSELDTSNIDTTNAVDISGMFLGNTNITSMDLSHFNTSNVTNMSSVFMNCTNLLTVNLDNFDVRTAGTSEGYINGGGFFSGSGVKEISAKNWKIPDKINYWLSTSWGCSNVEKIDVTGWDLSETTVMQGVFQGSDKLTEIVGLNTWNTSTITDMTNMFFQLKSIKSIDVSHFDTSHTTTMTTMFYGCSSIEELDLSNFTITGTTNFGSMISSMTNLKKLKLRNFDLSNYPSQSFMMNISGGGFTSLEELDVSNMKFPVNATYMFGGLPSVKSIDLTNVDTTATTNMDALFRNDTALESIDVSDFDTNNVTSMASMFYGCSNITELDLSNFNVSRITDFGSPLVSMTKLKKLNISNFDLSSYSAYSFMMNLTGGGLPALEEIDASNVKFPVNASYMFGGLPSVKSIDLTNVDTTLTTGMDAMFMGDSSLESIDVNDFDTSNVTNMGAMFQNCSNIAELDLTSFNTSNVTNMASMFSGASKITDLDLSSFNTSNVAKMPYMFNGCSELTTIYATDNFVTTNITETDNSKDMFKDATSLVGGSGTTYDANKIDKEYAHIDGGLLDPGYFTDKNAIRTTFDPNGGITYQTVIQSAENDVIDAPIPYRDQYVFDGWYTKKTGGEKITEIVTMQSTTYYAHWIEADEITITFNANGGTLSEEPTREILQGETAGKLPRPEKAPQIFQGWYTELTGGTKVTTEMTFNTNKTLYARWIDPISCTYDGDLVQGAEYTNGQYTYRYMQKQKAFYNSETKTYSFDWVNIEEEGWGVVLTDKESADPVTTPLCTNINGRPIAAMENMFRNSNATSIDTSTFETKDVVTMAEMFNNTRISSVDVTHFNTTRTRQLEDMFYKSDIVELDLSGFDVQEAVNFEKTSYYHIGSIFGGTNYLKKVNLSYWDFTGNTLSCAISSMGFVNSNSYIDELNMTGAIIQENADDFFTGAGVKKLILKDIDTSNVTNMSYMFYNRNYDPRQRFKFEVLDLSDFDTSNVTKFYEMFYQMDTIKELDLSNFNTSKATDFGYMFAYTKNLETVDLSSFDTSNADIMYDMFYNSDFVELDLSNFRFKPGVSISSMFYNMPKLETLSLKNWDFYEMNYQYSGLGSTLGLYESSYNGTRPKVIDLTGVRFPKTTSSLFYNLPYVEEIIMDDVDTYYVEDMSYMFYGCTGLKSLDLSSFYTPRLKSTTYMFAGNTALEKIMATNDFITDNVTNSDNMFSNSSNLVGGEGTKFDEEHLNVEYAHIDGGTSNPGYFSKKGPIEITFDSNTTEVNSKTIYGNIGEKIGRLPPISREKHLFLGWYTSPTDGVQITKDTIVEGTVTYYAHWVDATPYTITFDYNGGTGDEESRIIYDQHEIARFPNVEKEYYKLVGWYTGITDGVKVTEDYIVTDNMTLYARWEIKKAILDYGSNLNKKIKNLANNATDMTTSTLEQNIKRIEFSDSLPDGFTATTSNNLASSTSDYPIYSWFESGTGTFYYYCEIPKVYLNSSASYSFSGLDKIETAPGIESLDTSMTTSMSGIFWNYGEHATQTTIDLSGWDTSNVTSMYEMFRNFAYYNATWSITGIDDWDTSKVTNMGSLFRCVGSTKGGDFILDISKWNTSNVTTMNNMFYAAGEKSNIFRIDISEWDVSKVRDMDYFLYWAGEYSKSFSIGKFTKWNTKKVSTMQAFMGQNAISTQSACFDVGTLNVYATNIETFMQSDGHIRAIVNLYKKPTKYGNGALRPYLSECGSLVVNYSSVVTNIDEILGDTSSTKVTKGTVLEMPE